MKTQMRFTVVFAVILAIATLVGCTCGLTSRDPQKVAACYVENIAAELELNEAQTAKLHLVKDAMLKARAELRAGREQSQREALALLEKSTLDRQRGLGLVQQATRAFNDQASSVVVAFGDFFDSLTPAQQKKVREILKERMEAFNR